MTTSKHQAERVRPWVVKWMYGVVAGHVIAGVLLPWIGNLSLFDAYLESVATGFWPLGAPAEGRAQQVWWISLFGPTIQSVAVWMGALTYIGDKQRSPFAWMSLIVGVAIWAPQDMLISLRGDAWVHVWIDSVAVLVTLPPLFWLWMIDRQFNKAACNKAACNEAALNNAAFNNAATVEPTA